MTDREHWWLTATVWMEARGESDLGKRAVAHVVLNRLRAKRWGRTVGEVVLAPWQFSCWNTDSPTRKALALVDEQAGSWVDSAREALRAETMPDPTRGARHYYNPEVVRPDWDRTWYPRVTIGRHVFVADVP